MAKTNVPDPAALTYQFGLLTRELSRNTAVLMASAQKVYIEKDLRQRWRMTRKELISFLTANGIETNEITLTLEEVLNLDDSVEQLIKRRRKTIGKEPT